jgi:ABC-type transporter Mla MlaB component
MGETVKLSIDEDMTIYNAGSLKTRIINALGSASELELDLSAVSEIDTSGIQLLILAKREAVAAKKAMRITAHSRAVGELLDLYHIVAYFGDPLVIPAQETLHTEKQANAN